MSENGKKSRIAVSDAVLKSVRARRSTQPVVLKGVGQGKLVTISFEESKKLGLAAYQRPRITNEVNNIIHALRTGGLVPDPITVARREDNSLWIIDGQQRMWAHHECSLPIRAMVYDVENYEAEENFFIVMNDHVRLGADHIVNAWPGPSGTFLRDLNQRNDSPLKDRMTFGKSRGRSFGAAILARACVALLYPAVTASYQGNIYSILGRFDASMGYSGATTRLSAFVSLLGDLFPPGTRMKFLVGIALGTVAGKRWNGHAFTYPTPNIISKLRRLNWDRLVTSFQISQLPVAVSEISKRWPHIEPTPANKYIIPGRTRYAESTM